MLAKNIYLDYAATTPLDERVLQAMLPLFSENFGNTSSVHQYGQMAEAALEESRESMAQGLNCSPAEVIFTSCGSESDNLALRGSAMAARQRSGADHILISPVEHHAVSRTAQQLASLHDFQLEYLPVDEFGRVDPQEVKRRISPQTALVSVVYANNEIGTINSIAEIGAVCRAQGVPLHTDAVQAAAYLPVDVQALKVDLLSLGAHKFYGPKGIGALYVRKGTPILPVLTGGSQEFGLRAGTHNTPYIVGMAEAFRLAQVERASPHRSRAAAARPADRAGARGSAPGAPDRASRAASAESRQLRVPGCGRQRPAALPGRAGLRLLLRLGLQDRRPGALRRAAGTGFAARVGLRLAAGDPGCRDDTRTYHEVPGSVAGSGAKIKSLGRFSAGRIKKHETLRVFLDPQGLTSLYPSKGSTPQWTF